MKGALILMLEIYQPKGICWMGYRLSKQNPYTFHHIIEKRNGGDITIENGAILTKSAHNYLNFLDAINDKSYDKLNNLFAQLNKTFKPPTDEYWDELNFILKKAPKIYARRKQ